MGADTPKLELRAGVPVTMVLTSNSPWSEGDFKPRADDPPGKDPGKWHLWFVTVEGKARYRFFMPEPVHQAVAPRARKGATLTVLKSDLGNKRIGYSAWLGNEQVLGEGDAAQPPVPLAAVQPPPAAPSPQYLPPAPAPVPMPPPGKPAEPEPESYGVADLSGQVAGLALQLSNDMAAGGKPVSNDMALDSARTLYSTVFIGAQRSGRRVYLRPPLSAQKPIRDASLAISDDAIPDGVAPLATRRAEAAAHIANMLGCQLRAAQNLLVAHGGDQAITLAEIDAAANRAIAANPPKPQGVPRG